MIEQENLVNLGIQLAEDFGKLAPDEYDAVMPVLFDIQQHVTESTVTYCAYEAPDGMIFLELVYVYYRGQGYPTLLEIQEVSQDEYLDMLIEGKVLQTI